MPSMHRKLHVLLTAFLLTAISRHAFAFANGTVIQRQIQSQSLQRNLIGTNAKRDLTLYLPPSYDVSHERYPVVYMLGSTRTDVDHNHVADVFDRAITQKIIPPCIVVAVDLSTPIGPSWYTNSPVTGNWDDFATREMVPYIDTNFRTLPQSASRAVIGSFIGGYGALRLAILHPDIFGTVYAMHPVGTGSGVQVFTSRPDWGLLESATSLDQLKNAGFSTLFLSMFQAFLPDTAKPPLFATLPIESSKGTYQPAPQQIAELRARFFIAGLVPQHLSQIKSLRGIKMDWSRNDGIYDHIYANQELTHLLNEFGVEHEAEEFNGIGDPYWGTQARMLHEVLPFLAMHLKIDP